MAIGVPLLEVPASGPFAGVVLPLVVRAVEGAARGADGVAVCPPLRGLGETPTASMSVCSVICVTPASRGCAGGGPKSFGCIRYQAAAPPPPPKTSNDNVSHQIARDRRR